MIAYAPGDRVLVDDEHVIYTGEIVDMFLIVAREGRVPAELGYVVALDSADGSGPVLLATDGCLWPEHPRPVESEPDEPDGCHDWSRS